MKASLLYLTTVINVCEKLVDISGEGDLPSAYAQQLSHARICFETVMRLYYLRHGFEIPDGHMAHNSLFLAYKGLSQRNLSLDANEVMDEKSVPAEEARSTLILAAKALADQGKNYYLPRALLEIVENEMLPNDRNAARQYVTLHVDDSESLQARKDCISSRYPVGDWTVQVERNRRRLDILTRVYTTVARERIEGPGFGSGPDRKLSPVSGFGSVSVSESGYGSGSTAAEETWASSS
jgi:hypothetical protein